MEKVIISWSSGKDSALALYEVMKSPETLVVGLLTTIVKDTNKVSMHHVDRGLVEQQAAVLGLPLEVVDFNPNDSQAHYETSMRQALKKYMEQGVSAVVSGDINLVELRKRREENLAQIGLRTIFPLWERDTQELAEHLVQMGFKTVITSVDMTVLSRGDLGQVIDAQFLAGLPTGVDPCGENGEYHSFVFDGPIFKKPIKYSLGEVTSLDSRYFYCNLFPMTS